MDLNAQTFELLLDRFDRVDRDNEEIKKSITAHAQDDAKIADTVKKHATYWSLLLKIGTPLIIALVVAVAGKFF